MFNRSNAERATLGLTARQPERSIPVSKSAVLVNLLQAFCAIVFGNVVYFLLVPSFPPAARHQPFHLDLGIVIDFWFCLAAYGLIRTARKWK
jgi:hypothetical protein